MKHIEQIIVSIAEDRVGRLWLTPQHLCAFEYDSNWLQRGFSISPFELPLTTGIFVANPRPFDGGFGVFDDSLPDGWGMLLLDRLLRSQGINPNLLSVLDMLVYVGFGGRGALQFEPDRGLLTPAEEANLREIEHEVSALIESNGEDASLENLWRRGGSPGGARPKIFVKRDGAEWLVKFPSQYDPKNIGQEEYHYSLLARECGIAMPETRLFDDKYFGTMRFDRTKSGGRVHTVSAAGLIGADYRLPSLDYVSLISLTQQMAQCEDEVWRMFRLMIFNYLIGNRDDHAKNFSFVYSEGRWHLSPAYDLLPSHGLNGYHTTTFANHVTPSDEAIIEVASQCGLDIDRATDLLHSMQQIINNDANSNRI